MIKQVNTDKAPKAIGPYSQAVTVGDFVYCSGQIGLDPKTGELVKGVKKQTEQALKNLKSVLEEAGGDLKTVMKTTIFLADMNDFQVVNEVYGEHFKDHKPARSTVAVAALPKGALVEIEAFAIRAFDDMGEGCACGDECGCN